MQRIEIIEKLKDVMQMAVKGIDLEKVNESSELVADLGLGSVAVLYTVIAIEEFFDIRFDDVGFSDFKTVGDVVDYIEKKLA